ncbi:hypothetical protein AAFF_G00349300 [Aldrovandia affinis]|uniref:Uncharacterized protein n=1 Tax=Aldrovandia affinis TaxID=143900 RepID=A0AAD7WPI4_9TELE|nr:hypothetical protein AAFF_G00349300 [Aldrovandia affinis]
MAPAVSFRAKYCEGKCVVERMSEQVILFCIKDYDMDCFKSPICVLPLRPLRTRNDLDNGFWIRDWDIENGLQITSCFYFPLPFCANSPK